MLQRQRKGSETTDSCSESVVDLSRESGRLVQESI
jgi:hypothetical protein